MAYCETGWYRASPVAIQHLIVSAHGFGRRLVRRGRLFRKLLDDLEAQQWLSQGELEELQNEKLRALIEHCHQRVPYYREVMRDRGLTPRDIRTSGDLHKLPFLTKDTIRTQGSRLCREDLPRRKVARARTAGTTGTPLEFVRDVYSINFENASIWRQRRAAGFRFGERMIRMPGEFVVSPDVSSPPYWRHNWADNRLVLSRLHASSDTAAEYAQAMRLFGARALFTYASGAYRLAQMVRETSEDVSIDLTFTSSEPLYPHMRREIEEVFSSTVYDYYGQTERVVFAWECDVHEGLHLAPEYGVTELVEPEDEAPEGQLELVGTSLHNYAMPLIRYRTGDLTRRLEGQCPCGRATPRICPIDARVVSTILTPEGRRIGPLELIRVMTTADGIVRSQLVQQAPDRFKVRVVAAPGFDEQQSDRIVKGIRAVLHSDVRVSVERVDEIPRDRSGKYRWVVSEIDASGSGPREAGEDAQDVGRD